MKTDNGQLSMSDNGQRMMGQKDRQIDRPNDGIMYIIRTRDRPIEEIDLRAIDGHSDGIDK